MWKKGVAFPPRLIGRCRLSFGEVDGGETGPPWQHWAWAIRGADWAGSVEEPSAGPKVETRAA